MTEPPLAITQALDDATAPLPLDHPDALAVLMARVVPAVDRRRLDTLLRRGQPAAEAIEALVADRAGITVIEGSPDAVMLRHAGGAYLELGLEADAVRRVTVHEGAEAQGIAERIVHRATRAVAAAGLVGQAEAGALARLAELLGALTTSGVIRRGDISVRVGTTPLGVGVALAVVGGQVKEVRILRDDVAVRASFAAAPPPPADRD